MLQFSRIAAALACALSVYVSTGDQLCACTGLMLTAKDKSNIHGRTLEFAIEVDTSIAIIPRNYEFKATTPKGAGLTYKSKYAVVGAIAFDDPSILDGMNEKGLSIGTFYFPGFAKYAEVTAENQQRSLSPADFPNWVVTQFETVEEVRAALKNVVIVPTVVKGWGDDTPPFHYIVYDKAGKSIVIEPINATLVAYDNPTGVLTNSPNFEWQLTNLRNYINLTTFNAKPVNFRGLELTSFGQGSGMVGLPGDFTPPSRFVRASIFSLTAIPSNNATDAVSQIFHILNQFDIPIGVIREEANGRVYTDYTLMTAVRDPQNLKYYFKTYQDPTVKMVDLKQFDLDAKTLKTAKMSGVGQPIDVSSTLK